jgi:DNA-binding NarL/FixJ family response regulator
MDQVRVLVVDDHPIVRDGLAALLTSRPEVELVGLAAEGGEAVRLAEDLQPDVVLMDLHMPGTSGIEAIGRIARASPHIAVLVLTMLDDDDSLFAAMRAGARGYLVKGATQEEILGAVLAVACGEVVFGPAVASRVLDYFFREPPGRTRDLFPELTDRERQVLELVAQGLGNQVISTRLALSDKTVRNYVSNIFTKLHVADRARAIVVARDAGLGRRTD